MGDMFDDVMFQTMGAIAQEYNEEIMNSKEHYEYGQKDVSPKNDIHTKNNAMNKTSVLKSVSANGTYESQFGMEVNGKKLMFKYELEFENGDSGEYSSNKYDAVDKLPWKIGDKLDYQLQESGNTFPDKIKSPKKYQPPMADPKQASIIRQFAFREANLFLINHGYESQDVSGQMNETAALAERIIKWVNNE